MGIHDVTNDTKLYRTPEDLRVQSSELKRILVVGSCLSEGFAGQAGHFEPGCESDFILYNNYAQLPADPPHPACEYNFQIVQIPLRSVVPENAYFRLTFDDIERHKRAFSESRDRLFQLLDGALRWNREHGILTFVTNFMLPQQNPMGRLLPRRDLRNFVHFVDQLNDAISDELQNYKNSYVFDLDQISATFGRKYFQDDVLWQINHGAGLNDADHELDQGRIHPPRPVSQHYTLRTYEFLQAWWSELVAMYRTIRQIDSVKLVVVDLDDTLWRGLVIEDGIFTNNTMEGWPLGFIEALSFLKKRGILLAIVSKNDESKVEAIWPQLFRGRLELSDFVVRKINWLPKAENIGNIISDVNVLPRSVVFIDDNPVERAAVSAAFPDIRVLGADLYYLRRILLWSPETQVPFITKESTRRTEMTQAQVERESVRKKLSREEFLATLALKVALFEIREIHDARFPRAFELVNKSNQFNTTGRRWTNADAAQFFTTGGVFYAFEVEDKFTNYGLTGVMIVSNIGCIEQFVMSCRVIGLEIETSMVAEIGRRLSCKGIQTITAKVIHTDANSLSRDLFQRSGMSPVENGMFSGNADELPPPASHLDLA